MTVEEIKKVLKKSSKIKIELPNGKLVPQHFHVTEVGLITKDFIDCGGKMRHEKKVNFQLWSADDYNHRLHPEKLAHIIELSQTKLGFGDFETEVEYQSETIGKYGLDYDPINESFLLTQQHTTCLALDQCGVPEEKPKFNLSDLTSKVTNCKPGSGCC